MGVTTDSGPLILFRADASTTIGSGHVMRCLTLAAEIARRKARIVFVTRNLPDYLANRIAYEGYRHIVIDPTQGVHSPEGADAGTTLSVIGKLGEIPKWVIVDHYGLGAAWETAIGAVGSSVLAIDDLANRTHQAQVLLDQNLVRGMDGRYAGLVPGTTLTLLGPCFAMLQPDYRNARGSILRGGVAKRVLVYFGAADTRLTSLAATAHLQNALPDVAIDIVLDEANIQFASLSTLSAAEPSIALHKPMSSLAGLMAQADLFIGAGGATSWERLCLGLPSIVVSLADNQLLIAAELDRRGYGDWIGGSDEITVDTLARAIVQAFAREFPEERTASMMQIVDGLGVDRVCDVLHMVADVRLRCRDVHPDDSDMLLAWANDAGTRRFALQQRRIEPTEHRAWFARRLANPDVAFLIIESPFGIPVGQVRFERGADGIWVISYVLAPLFRGRGLGRPLLQTGLDAFAVRNPDAFVMGLVKAENTASIRIFRALGFEEGSDITHGTMTFRRGAAEH